MTESESEDETIERLETALRRIAGATSGQHRPIPAAAGQDMDREALARSLDMLIARLRAGLKPANPAPQTTE
jgi:hypothetical protein